MLVSPPDSFTVPPAGTAKPLAGGDTVNRKLSAGGRLLVRSTKATVLGPESYSAVSVNVDPSLSSSTVNSASMFH